MIRFILRRRLHNTSSDLDVDELYTMDAVVPDLESTLSQGGFGPSGYEMHSIAGFEIHPERQTGDETHPLDIAAREALDLAEQWDRCYPGNVNIETVVNELSACLRAYLDEASRRGR